MIEMKWDERKAREPLFTLGRLRIVRDDPWDTNAYKEWTEQREKRLRKEMEEFDRLCESTGGLPLEDIKNDNP